MDVATTSEVESTVSAMVSQRKPFSAFDITKSVRQAGFKERHGDVKRIVHQLYADNEMSDYTRTLITFPGGNGPAFLYHPPEIDPNTVVSGQPIQASSPTPSSTNTANSDGSTPGNFIQTKSQKQADGSFLKTLGNSPRSILYVPQRFVRQLVAVAYPVKDVFFRIDAGNIVLRTDPHGLPSFYTPTTGLTTFTGTPIPKWQKAQRDSHDNVRIGKIALKEAGISGKAKIEIRGGTGKNAEILITQA